MRKQCVLAPRPQSEFIGVLAAIFVPLLIEKAFGGIGGALKKAGSEETLKDSGRLPTYLYRLPREKPKPAKPPAKDEPEKSVLDLNPDFGCVLVVRGTFARPGEQLQKNQDPEEETRLNQLRNSGIPIREIAAVYEAEIILSQDGTALRYESRFLEVNQFQGARSHDKRVMVVSVAITGAGEKEGEPVLSLVMVNLGEVKKGTIFKPTELESKRTSWVGGLGITEASLKALETIQFPANPTDPKDSDYKHFLEIMPVTVEGVFTETDDGNKALRFIGEVLESTKGEVSKALSSEILKDRSKQAADAANAKEALLQEEEAAFAAYLEAKAARKKLENEKPTAEEKAAKDFETKRTGRAWCRKFSTLQKLGIAPPTRPADCPITQ